MLAKKIAVILLAVSLVSCRTQGNETERPTPEVLEGELRLVGSEPATMVMLRPSSGGQEIRLHGPLMNELRRLSGVVVSVDGRMGGTAMQGFDVQRYEIVSVNGQQPSVGTIVSRDGEFWLEGDASVRLINVPAGLRSQIGAKVWVLGTAADGSLRPVTYGVIRQPQ